MVCCPRCKTRMNHRARRVLSCKRCNTLHSHSIEAFLVECPCCAIVVHPRTGKVVQVQHPSQQHRHRDPLTTQTMPYHHFSAPYPEPPQSYRALPRGVPKMPREYPSVFSGSPSLRHRETPPQHYYSPSMQPQIPPPGAYPMMGPGPAKAYGAKDYEIRLFRSTDRKQHGGSPHTGPITASRPIHPPPGAWIGGHPPTRDVRAPPRPGARSARSSSSGAHTDGSGSDNRKADKESGAEDGAVKHTKIGRKRVSSAILSSEGGGDDPSKDLAQNPAKKRPCIPLVAKQDNDNSDCRSSSRAGKPAAGGVFARAGPDSVACDKAAMSPAGITTSAGVAKA